MVQDLMSKLNEKIESLFIKKYLFEKTETLQNVIVPNWTPFQAINFFCDLVHCHLILNHKIKLTQTTQMKTTQTSWFFVFFYEKLGAGFYYESVESHSQTKTTSDDYHFYQYAPKLAEGEVVIGWIFHVEKFESRYII